MAFRIPAKVTAREQPTRFPTGQGLSLSLTADYALGKDCIMHGYMSKMGNPFLTQWQRRYFYLFPNRLEWRGEGEAPVRMGPGAGAGLAGAGLFPHRPCPSLPALQQSLLTMEEIQSVEETQIKERKCLLLKIRGGKQFVLQCDVSGVWGPAGRGVWGLRGLRGPQASPDRPPGHVQSDPELVQWKKELRDAYREAQQLVQRVPKMKNKARSPVVELSKVPLVQRGSANGL